jgi:prepilin-type processing-associated H-X9-DG protein
MATGISSASTGLENPEKQEPEDIAAIVKATETQLQFRYAAAAPFLRGVHAKSHGCVRATFTVRKDLPDGYSVGLFADPGRQFEAELRFSNAAPLVRPDSVWENDPSKPGKKRIKEHGSRGMAVKLHGVPGVRLLDDKKDTQDFLMINQPVFAFANVEDYRALSEAIVLAQSKGDKEETPMAFFARGGALEVQKRTKETMRIIGCIKSSAVAPDPLPPSATGPFAFQPPPLSPLDNRYFSAAPFLFGDGHVAKFRAKPVAPVLGELGDELHDDNYLRIALRKRLAAAEEDVVFKFQVQKRPVDATLDVDNDIENACTLWDQLKYPFVTVAKISIPKQSIEDGEEACEKLVFSPWTGLAQHRPLGGINRLRLAVYEKSAGLR